MDVVPAWGVYAGMVPVTYAPDELGSKDVRDPSLNPNVDVVVIVVPLNDVDAVVFTRVYGSVDILC